jgi:hypothetical protein
MPRRTPRLRRRQQAGSKVLAGPFESVDAEHHWTSGTQAEPSKQLPAPQSQS